MLPVCVPLSFLGSRGPCLGVLLSSLGPDVLVSICLDLVSFIFFVMFPVHVPLSFLDRGVLVSVCLGRSFCVKIVCFFEVALRGGATFFSVFRDASGLCSLVFAWP